MYFLVNIVSDNNTKILKKYIKFWLKFRLTQINFFGI